MNRKPLRYMMSQMVKLVSDSRSPRLSVIVPVRNEAQHIESCLHSIIADEPSGGIEVLVVDGMSDDGTPEIVRKMAQQDPRIRLIENPDGFVPHAMNVGIRASVGRYVGRVDGHCRVERGYFAGCLEHLESGRYACVGGSLVNEGSTVMGRAIAAAMSSPVAVGAASFRTDVAGKREVDTLAFGVYRREIFEQIGGFDEALVRNQDDELNLRVTRAGERILLVPELRVRYHVRSSLGTLWRQYFQYGYWKLRVMIKHRRIVALRHVVPSGFLVGLVLLGLLSIWSSTARWVLIGAVGVYAGALLVEGCRIGVPRRASFFRTVLSIAVMHFGYGWGLLMAVLRSVVGPGSKKSVRHTRLSR